MKKLYNKQVNTRLNKFTRIRMFSFLVALVLTMSVSGQAVLFDFNEAPLHSPLPVALTVGGITAHFTATGDGYSIQDNSAPVFPIGFSGRDIYPNGVFLADLLIHFDQSITDFSIMYSCQELGCDDAATMRVTAYKNGAYVGTNTMTAKYPGTWPVDTLRCSFVQGFDSVVLHYDHRPPTCQDYGVIFLCDNMRVTPASATGIINQKINIDNIIVSNPSAQTAQLTFWLVKAGFLRISLFDLNGRWMKDIFKGDLNAGAQQFSWNPGNMNPGVYILNISDGIYSTTCKWIRVK